MPADWPRRRLGEVLRLEYGKPLPEKERRPGLAAVVGSAGVVGAHNEGMLPGPGIVIGRKGSIGKVTWLSGPFFPIDTTYFVDFVDGEVDPRWTYHTLSRADLPRLNRATGIPGLNRDDVHAIIRPIPPLPEQRAIAAVLDAVDETVERTEAVIAATEELRRALLHELLTRGVPGWHSEWKHVPGLGTVPACWEVVRLGDVCTRITKGTTPTTLGHAYVQAGIRFLRVENISDDGRIAGGELRYIDDEANRVLSRSILQENDLLLSIAGALGRSALVTNNVLPANTNQALAIIRLADQASLLPTFLAAALRGEGIQRQVQDMRAELAQANISLEQVGSLMIPVPSSKEQQRISEVVHAVDAEHDMLISLREHKFVMKRALADALLTGAWRVPVEALG